MFSIHFLRTWQGEFFNQSRASLVDDHSFILVTLMCDLGVIRQSVLDKIVHPRIFLVYLPYERNLSVKYHLGGSEIQKHN